MLVGKELDRVVRRAEYASRKGAGEWSIERSVLVGKELDRVVRRAEYASRKEAGESGP